MRCQSSTRRSLKPLQKLCELILVDKFLLVPADFKAAPSTLNTLTACLFVRGSLCLFTFYSLYYFNDCILRTIERLYCSVLVSNEDLRRRTCQSSILRTITAPCSLARSRPPTTLPVSSISSTRLLQTRRLTSRQTMQLLEGRHPPRCSVD